MLNLQTLNIANPLQLNHSTRALLFGTRANSESPCFCGCVFLSAGTFRPAAALMMIFLLFFIVMVPYLKPNCRSLAQQKLCAPHFSLWPRSYDETSVFLYCNGTMVGTYNLSFVCISNCKSLAWQESWAPHFALGPWLWWWNVCFYHYHGTYTFFN